MSQYFKITYVRKQVTTDYLPGGSTRETTTEITESIGGLPGSTVANYRKVLGAQLISVEPEMSRGSGFERTASHKATRSSKSTNRTVISGPAAAAVKDDDTAFTGSYAGIVNRMVAKEKAA